MFAIAAGILICAARYALCRLSTGQCVSVDGTHYLAAGDGKTVEAPFAYRPLLPWLLRGSPLRWQWVSGIAQILTGGILAAFLLLKGATTGQAVAGVVLWCGLPGVFHLPAALPVLTDAVSHFLAITSAVCVLTGHFYAAVAIAAIGGVTRETVPVWAAVLAWHPLPLLGLLAWFIMRDDRPAKDRSEEHGWLAQQKRRGAGWFDPMLMLLPWGVCLVAMLSTDPQVWVAFGLGYACLLLAGDSRRLYQQGAAIPIAAAVTIIPGAWLPIACVGHWFLIGALRQHRATTPGI